MATKKKKEDAVGALKIKVKDLEQQLKGRIKAHELDVNNSADMVDKLTKTNNEYLSIIEELRAERDTSEDKCADTLKIKEGYVAKVKELTDANVKLTKEKTGFALLSKKLYQENALLKDTHESVKTAAIKAVGGNLDIISVPTLANKARAVSACRKIEEIPACCHIKDFIVALRLFIEDHCK